MAISLRNETCVMDAFKFEVNNSEVVNISVIALCEKVEVPVDDPLENLDPYTRYECKTHITVFSRLTGNTNPKYKNLLLFHGRKRKRYIKVLTNPKLHSYNQDIKNAVVSAYNKYREELVNNLNASMPNIINLANSKVSMEVQSSKILSKDKGIIKSITRLLEQVSNSKSKGKIRITIETI